MRIAFVHSHKFRFDGNFYYSTGGLSNHVLSKYCGAVDELYVYSRVISTNDSSKLSKITSKNIHIQNIQCVNLEKELIKADAIVIRLPCLIGYKACRIAQKHKKKVLVEVVGSCFDALWNHGFFGRILAIPMEFKMKKCVKKSSFATYVTNSFLQKEYPCPGKTLACSDVEMPSPTNEVLDARIAKINTHYKDNIFVLGTLAAIDVKYKSQETVIKAISLLKKKGIHNIVYELVGGGSNKRLLDLAQKYDVKEQVVFKGTFSHDKVFEWLDRVDLYIQPSKQEGLPRALLEAMSRGCPSIGSTCGGIPELLSDEYLFVHGTNSIKRLSALIEKALEKEQLSKMAFANFELSKRYATGILEKQWFGFYREFIDSK